MSNNSWATDAAANGYSREKFYTVSTNKKGFTSSIRVNVPPDVLSSIGALVASKDIPDYRTLQDFLRDALVHRLHDVNDMIAGDFLHNATKMFLRMAEAERAAEHRAAINRLIEMRRMLVKEEKSPRRMREALTQLQEDIEMMDDSFDSDRLYEIYLEAERELRYLEAQPPRFTSSS